ncbi:MAG: methyltransferase domain-containing protein [Flavobacterium sp.]
MLLESITTGKIGVEIGGPSQTGSLIYSCATKMDNIIFSRETVWSSHSSGIYNYYPGKTGNVIINDAVNITNVGDAVYDFIFSSHCLEHIANPIKALNEWLRIIKTGGHVILILPERTQCFDHKREISKFSTLISQYEKNVGEDDLSTLPEILKNHDLAMDPPAGDLGSFTRRSLDNYNNRCLHHYVYSPELLMEICTYLGCEFIYTVTHGLDIWFIMKKI